MYFNQIQELESSLKILGQPQKPEVYIQLLSYYQTKDITKAHAYARLVEETLRKVDFKQNSSGQLMLLENLVNWYEFIGDFKRAFYHQKKLYKISVAGSVIPIPQEAVSPIEIPELNVQLKAILDSLPLRVCYLSRDMEYLYTNKAYMEGLSYHKKDLIGSSAKKVLGKQAFGSIYYYLQKALGGEQVSYQQEMDYKSGKEWVQTKLYPVKDQINFETVGVIAVIEDVSEIRKLSRNLENSNEALTQFAYATSHDLKEPIRSIVSFTQILQKQLEGKLSEQQQEAANLVVGGAKRLHRIIDDLEEYASVDKDFNVFEGVDLNLIVSGAMNNLEALISKNEAIICYDNLPTIKSNPRSLFLLFQHLIENALKYRSSERSPHIEIKYIDQLNSHFFYVKDNGVGFDPVYKDKIFSLFKRLHNQSEVEGTGIGLPICQKIVRDLNGYIWAESIVGQGSTFYINIPKTEKKPIRTKNNRLTS